jgi:hypothetical protein|tara:strand:+ start:161 stop:1285 length:1125 start_codon:yes stop_codon:yes gene_type:complete
MNKKLISLDKTEVSMTEPDSPSSKHIEFLLPGLPAPIGGFKVIYQHAQTLTAFGYTVNVQHVNPTLYRAGFIRKSLSYLNFIRRQYFYKWKTYPKQYGLQFSVSNRIILKGKTNLLVVASWQLLEQVMADHQLRNENVMHICQDFPGYMGPKEKVIESWMHMIPYLSVSRYLSREILRANPSARVMYLPSIAGTSAITNVSDKKEKIFCVISSGTYKNQPRLIELLNMLSGHIAIETFSRSPRPLSLNSSIKHFQNLSDDEIEMGYSEAKYSICYSEFEGFGLPAFDAMSNSCISFTTDNLGNRDYIQPTKNCIMLDGSDVMVDFRYILDVINTTLVNTLEIAKAGKLTCTTLVEKYDNHAVLDVYNSLLSTKS